MLCQGVIHMHSLISNPRCPINALRALVRSECVEPCSYRHYSTSTTEPRFSSIAVLGGGITGLASAYFLSKDLPNTKITLYEASSRLGGWLHSRSVDIGSGNVIFEQGPRNLRPTIPNGLVTLTLVGEEHMHCSFESDCLHPDP